jgi:hypothetical protein
MGTKPLIHVFWGDIPDPNNSKPKVFSDFITYPTTIVQTFGREVVVLEAVFGHFL